MAKGNEIIVSGNPKGVFLEGIIASGETPSPGTVMQIKAATEPVGGRHTWEVYDAGNDGDQRLIAVLLPDSLQGKLATDAYAAGKRCFLYCPIAGEDLNMLVAVSGTGTGDSQAIGDLLIVDDGTGILVPTSSGEESEPFIVMETLADVVAGGTLTWCKFTGY